MIDRIEARVHVAEGIVRQYSLCNVAGETDRYQIGVLRDPTSRGGSLAMHDQVRVGDVLKISAPKNHFPLHTGSQGSLLFAGGVGVTPILAMAEHLAGAGATFEMHYCTRAAARTAFVERIRSCSFADNVRFHHDDGPAEQKLDLASSLEGPASATHLYVCGPSGFMNAVIATARDQGWKDEQIHFEYFSGGSPRARRRELRCRRQEQREGHPSRGREDRRAGPRRAWRRDSDIVRARRVWHLPHARA